MTRLTLTKDEAQRINPQVIQKLSFYHGVPDQVGIWIDKHTDPIYYLITNRVKWGEAGHPQETEEEILKFGIRFDRRQVSNVSEVKYGADNHTSIDISSIPSFSTKDIAKKLIIIGAGASYDFLYDEEELDSQWQPPLVNSLFDKRFDDTIRKYPGVSQMIAELRLPNNKDIEQFFQEQWQSVHDGYHPDTLKELINVQFYLMELFLEISNRSKGKSSNNYQILARKARKYFRDSGRKTLWVNFNYDTLLESAIQNSAGITRPWSINDYVSNSIGQIVIKPHGSCNWCSKLNQVSPRMSSYEDYISAIAHDIYSNDMDYHAFKSLLADSDIMTLEEITTLSQSIFPSLLIPYHSKDDFVLPNFHQHFFKHYLEGVEEILVVGWKGNETKFLELLRKSVRKKGINLTVVDPYPDAVVERLSGCLALGSINTDSGKSDNEKPLGFSHFVSSEHISKFWSE